MITTIIIASFISLLIRLTDEEKPLRKLFAIYASKVNGIIYKATVECLECRCFWLSFLALLTTSIWFGNIYYLFFTPICWVLSIWFYKIIAE